MTVPAVAFTAPEITVDGSAPPDTWLQMLVSILVRKELGLVGRAVLTFNDVGYQLAETNLFGLGSDVVIKIDNKSVFAGVVTGSALDHGAGALPRLVVTADDAGFRLGLTQRMKPYVKKSHSDIITELCSMNGLSADVGSSGAVNDHIVQRTSDLDFLDMLVRRLNRVWWVEGTKLHVAEPAVASTPVQLDAAEDLDEFSVRASGLRPLGVDVHGWDLKQKQNVVGQAKAEAAPATATSDFVTDYVGNGPARKLATTSSNVLTTTANPLSQDEAQTIAKAQVATWGASAVVARGTVAPGNPQIKLNGQVKVVNVGPMSGTYTVTSIEHSFDRRGLVTRFVCGSLRPAGLVDTLASSAGVDDGLTVRTVTTGVVTNIKDPDSLGRVKVQFAGTDDTLESDWARVMTLGGGANRGIVFHPEVNDEVVVAFERGDTRRPVVLGGLVNGKDALASAGKILNDGGGAVDYRRITSRLGHIVELADGDSPKTKHILLQLANGTNKVRLGDDEMTIDLAAGKPFTITVGKAKIAIDAQGNIAIEGMKISLKATTDLELSANAKLAAKGLEVDVAGQISAKLGAAMVSVEAQGQAALKGAIVMIN